MYCFGILFWYNDVIFISVNNGTPETAVFTWTPRVHTTATFSMGDLGTSGYYYLDGALDMVGLWSRRLIADELTSLYNSGAGLDYPFAEGETPISIKGNGAKVGVYL